MSESDGTYQTPAEYNAAAKERGLTQGPAAEMREEIALMRRHKHWPRISDTKLEALLDERAALKQQVADLEFELGDLAAQFCHGFDTHEDTLEQNLKVALDERDRDKILLRQMAEALKVIREQYTLFVGPDDAISNAVLKVVDDCILEFHKQENDNTT